MTMEELTPDAVADRLVMGSLRKVNITAKGGRLLAKLNAAPEVP